MPQDRAQPGLHLPSGGPCVMRMSMPSGTRFHLSSRDWPRGRLKPHPLNHGVLWGRQGTGCQASGCMYTPTLPSLSSLFGMVGPGSSALSVDCLEANPSESKSAATTCPSRKKTFLMGLHQNLHNALFCPKLQCLLRYKALI